MVSVPSGYVWEKELACGSCHRVFTQAALPGYQIPIDLESHRRRAAHAPGHKH